MIPKKYFSSGNLKFNFSKNVNLNISPTLKNQLVIEKTVDILIVDQIKFNNDRVNLKAHQKITLIHQLTEKIFNLTKDKQYPIE